MCLGIYIIIVLLCCLVALLLGGLYRAERKSSYLSFREFHAFMFDFEERITKIIEENDQKTRTELLKLELQHYDRIRRQLEHKIILPESKYKDSKE